jgi:hypothetical protein
MMRSHGVGWRSVILVLFIAFSIGFAVSLPEGPSTMNVTTLNYTPQGAAQLVTAGGSFTTMNLNITSQTPRWKAYVGNVTGVLTLNDGLNSTIYDWTPGTVTGEVYASRRSNVSFGTVSCANSVQLGNEETALNITPTRADSLNATFNTTAHRGFYVGTTSISANSCYAISTFVNDTRQSPSENSAFQEPLLSDGYQLIYTTLLENHKYGFNNQKFDFQMIIPNNEFEATPTPYYFFVEIG